MFPLRKIIEEKLRQLTRDYCRERKLPVIWRAPIVRFADAEDPGFPELRQIVTPEHHLPQDFLPDAKNVMSWFLPFLPEVGRNNLTGELSSPQWAQSYLVTNEMAAWINDQLVSFIQNEMGAAAAVPTDAGMIGTDNPRSR